MTEFLTDLPSFWWVVIAVLAWAVGMAIFLPIAIWLGKVTEPKEFKSIP